MYMTVCSQNFVKFTVIKPNCQKHSGCVFASGKNAMYPITYVERFRDFSSANINLIL